MIGSYMLARLYCFGGAIPRIAAAFSLRMDTSILCENASRSARTISLRSVTGLFSFSDRTASLRTVTGLQALVAAAFCCSDSVLKARLSLMCLFAVELGVLWDRIVWTDFKGQKQQA